MTLKEFSCRYCAHETTWYQYDLDRERLPGVKLPLISGATSFGIQLPALRFNAIEWLS